MYFAVHISHKLLRIEIENVVEMQSCKLISGKGNIIMYLSYYVYLFNNNNNNNKKKIMNVSITLGLIIDSTKFISHDIQVGLITFVYNFVCVRSRLCIIGIYYTAFFYTYHIYIFYNIFWDKLCLSPTRGSV